jgi:hypothetical protein
MTEDFAKRVLVDPIRLPTKRLQVRAASSRRPAYELDGDVLVPAPDTIVEQAPLPDELYLVLANTANDARSMLRFADRHGVLGVRYPLGALLADYAGPLDRFQAFGAPVNPPADVADAIEAIAGSGLDVENTRAETLAEFRLGQAAIRDATQAWLVVDGQLDLKDASWSLRWIAKRPPRDRYDAAHQLGLIAPALSLFPRFHFEGDEDTDIARYAMHRLPVAGQPLYHICCAQLANHIAERARYRTCENCGRWYVRHQGRAEHGQHRRRGGVRFCSQACSSAAASRDYRRRRAARTEGDHDD